MFRFAWPWAFAALVPAALVLYAALRRRSRRSVAVAAVRPFVEAGLVAPRWRRHLRTAIRALVLVLLVLAIARPQTGRSELRTWTEGIDIVLVLDCSGSMQAEDFRPKNRLHVAREVIKEFIDRRRHDRIALVAFAAQAVTQCPLTLDYTVLKEQVDRVTFGMLEDGTAIGVALATACNRLRESHAKSRVVILLTDGQNNAGEIDPATAARVAATLGIRVYTIGVGTRGRAPMPVDDPVFGRRMVMVPVDLDEDTLQEIARITGGRYFRATNRAQLHKIYADIDAMEKTKIESTTYVSYTERYRWFLLPALALLVVEMIVGPLWLREWP